ncbi:isopropylmalate isomerase [Altererythrobacter sp. FM1]|uniref:Isopropylmalate isomerase n=1 Tax=Tsuneonella flava TaxID=2055955 RepID=A0ABX7KAV7_9SPHN|nr:isopropylmalate isomerase [Tsuneonella flava]QSB45396.1 isopropylmalate isomerase [Tsuneonella flava]ROT97091.1 isopropylmalate isomerase [Altererythrobacter sp. FM1]
MTKKLTGKAAAMAAGAIGSAAVAAALLYANKRKEKKANSPDKPGAIPSGEAPETD